MGTVTTLLVMGGIMGSYLLLLVPFFLLAVASVAARVWWRGRFLRKEHEPQLRANALETGRGQWYAKVLVPEGAWGVLDVADGRVAFTRDGAAGPEWSLPLAEVTVADEITRAHVPLHHPLLGRVRVRVSGSRNARLASVEEADNRADRAAARTVAQVLCQGGATASAQVTADPVANARTGGRGQWFVQPRLGGAPAGPWGRAEVADGRLTYVPYLAPQPAWSVAVQEASVSTLALVNGFTLAHPALGTVQLVVSDGEGVRWSSGDDRIPDRTRALAKELREVLLGWGARPL